MKKCAIYMYTDLTNRNDLTLNAQYEMLGAYCTKHNYQVAAFTLDLKTEECAPEVRPTLDELLDQMDKHKCNALLIASSNRIPQDMNLKYNVKLRLFEMNAQLISIC